MKALNLVHSPHVAHSDANSCSLSPLEHPALAKPASECAKPTPTARKFISQNNSRYILAFLCFPLQKTYQSCEFKSRDTTLILNFVHLSTSCLSTDRLFLPPYQLPVLLVLLLDSPFRVPDFRQTTTMLAKDDTFVQF